MPLEQKSTVYPVALLLADLAIFGVLVVGAAALQHWLLQLACALVAGFWIGRLFILGHDACHQAYT